MAQVDNHKLEGWGSVSKGNSPYCHLFQGLTMRCSHCMLVALVVVAGGIPLDLGTAVLLVEGLG